MRLKDLVKVLSKDTNLEIECESEDLGFRCRASDLITTYKNNTTVISSVYLNYKIKQVTNSKFYHNGSYILIELCSADSKGNE